MEEAERVAAEEESHAEAERFAAEEEAQKQEQDAAEQAAREEDERLAAEEAAAAQEEEEEEAVVDSVDENVETFSVECPEGVVAGDALSVLTASGTEVTVILPEGVSPG